ncbi:MAG: cation diffusion facilitator family transporter [Actinomycetales bacterium]|nr:cation diffusion facilitator family transporter [Actinomycetales bacterium]
MSDGGERGSADRAESAESAESAEDASTGEASESVTTVLIAMGANLLIAIAKSVAAVLTASAAMVAEAAHSWADTGNQVLLFLAQKRSARPADATHPLGYGKDAYIWSMFAAFGLFTAGAVLSIQHGIRELVAAEPGADYLVAYLVLAAAFVLEGISFVRALRQARAAARERSAATLTHVLASSNPTLRAVFAEDSAALLGILLAGSGLLLHQLTGDPVWDALASILIGVLLGVVAVVLIARNRAFLLGQVVSERARDEALDWLQGRAVVERVTYLHIEYVGPSRVLLVAAVDLVGDDRESRVAERLRDLELELEREPEVAEAVLTLSRPAAAPLTASSARRTR